MGSEAEAFQERVTAANTAARSVGAAVSLRVDGERTDAAAGLVDGRYEDPVTVSTPFRLGSIAKVCTASTLKALLADSGCSLEDPVVDLLPGCVPDAAVTATWRQVLTHGSGIDGTFWEGFGDEPDAIRRYAEQVSTLPVVFDPGTSWGYSNSGFVLAGAAVEALTGDTFDNAVTDHILRPIGLRNTTLWSETPPDGAANGHYLTGEGHRPADVPTGTRAMAPTGSAGFSTAADVLDLADRLLADTWRDLAENARPMPPGGGTAATHQALGWRVYRWGDTVMFGHDGGATGMGSFVRWVPQTQTGIAVMSNTNPSAMLLWAELSDWFFQQAGITVPGWLTATDHAEVEQDLCGTYVARDATFTIGLGDGTLTLDLNGMNGTMRRSAVLKPLAPGVYRADQMITDPTRIISFEQPSGGYRLLHAGPFTAPALRQ